MADLKAFAEQLVNLTVKEVNELAEILKNEYGIEPAAAAVAVAAPAAGGAAAEEEKSSFDVVLSRLKILSKRRTGFNFLRNPLNPSPFCLFSATLFAFSSSVDCEATYAAAVIVN